MNKKIPVILLFSLALGIIIIIDQLNSSRGRRASAQATPTEAETQSCGSTDDVCCSKYLGFFNDDEVGCETNNCVFIELSGVFNDQCLSKRTYCETLNEDQCKTIGRNYNRCFPIYENDKYLGCNFEKPTSETFCQNQNVQKNNKCDYGCQEQITCKSIPGAPTLPSGGGCGIGEQNKDNNVILNCTTGNRGKSCYVLKKCVGTPTPEIYTPKPGISFPEDLPPPPANSTTPSPASTPPTVSTPIIPPLALPKSKSSCENFNDNEDACNNCTGKNCIFCPAINSENCQEINLCRYKKNDKDTTCESINPPKTTVDLICDDDSQGTLISNVIELLDCLNHPKCKIEGVDTLFPRCVSVGGISLNYEKKENSCVHFFKGIQESSGMNSELTLNFQIPSLKKVTVTVVDGQPLTDITDEKISPQCGINTCKFTLKEESMQTDCNIYNKNDNEGTQDVTEDGITSYCWNDPQCCIVTDSANYSQCVARPKNIKSSSCFLPNQTYCQDIMEKNRCSPHPLCCYDDSNNTCSKRNSADPVKGECTRVAPIK